MVDLALAFFLFRVTLFAPESYPYIIYVDASKETRTYANIYEEEAQGFVTNYTFILTDEPEKARKYPNKFIAETAMYIVNDRYKANGWNIWINPYSLDPREFMPNYKAKPIYELTKTYIFKPEA